MAWWENRHAMRVGAKNGRSGEMFEVVNDTNWVIFLVDTVLFILEQFERRKF